MKYGEIFELTGKGKLQDLRHGFMTAMHKADRRGDEKARELLAHRMGQAGALDRSNTVKKENSGAWLEMARRDRFRSKDAALDAQKPSDWLEKKKLQKNMGLKLNPVGRIFNTVDRA